MISYWDRQALEIARWKDEEIMAEQEQFTSGAVRDSQKGKGRFDLISPLALRAIAIVCEKGAANYSDRNWEKGMNIGRTLCSALRHLSQALAGETDEDHLAHAAWNCMAAIHILEMIRRGRLPKDLDDRPDYQPRSDLPPGPPSLQRDPLA